MALQLYTRIVVCIHVAEPWLTSVIKKEEVCWLITCHKERMALLAPVWV